MTDHPTNPADRKFVVIENGQRVTAPLETREQADAEAQKRNRVAESTGTPVPENHKAKVAQNLCG